MTTPNSKTQQLAGRATTPDNNVRSSGYQRMSPKPNPLTRGKKQKAHALLQHSQLTEAKPLLEQVCRADRRDAEAWYLLAAVNQKLGVFEQAADAYCQVITLEPRHAEAHYYLGNARMALGDGEGAIAAFQQAVALRSDYLEAHVNLGALRELRKDFPGAEKNLREALRLDPHSTELYFRLGNVLQSQKKYAAAVESYQQALALRLDHADLYNNLGNALAHQDRIDEALETYRQALIRQPDLVAAYNNMGNALARRWRLDESIDSYQHALQIQPTYAEARTNLGNIKRFQGKLDESEACHRLAIQYDPDYADAHYNLAHTLLLTGCFRDGWKEYDWRWLREGGGQRPYRPTPWNGSDLGGQRVFLHSEQGLGDEIFFLRFAAELRQRGAGSIAYRPHRKIRTLIANASIVDHLLDTTAAPAPTDAVFAVGDLPRLLGMERIDQIPPPLPLIPLPEWQEKIRRRLSEAGPPPYLGGTWRAGTPHDELSLYKEAPHQRLAQLLRECPATILVLQRKPGPGEIEAFSQTLGHPTHDLSALNEDLEQMLALLSLIDEYVGVSNTNMHLRAGAGKTARVLVPAPPEWRWMAKGKESPWFPGFGVYRQRYDGSWDEAFDMLATDLKQAHGT